MIKKFLSLILVCTMIAAVLALLSSCGKPDTGQTTSYTEGQEQPPELTDGRTLFIYMCGSNLETKQGLAGKNIKELLAADTGDLNIVIQTGGAKTWRSFDIDSSAAQRYEVKNGELVLLDTLSQLNMGEAETLTDFLKWGQKQYHTKNNMLILWDHGGGSAKGVCFDENYGFDGLTLIELKTALENAGLYTKFDIIGFDACLMASIETVAAVKDYAWYMVASEEIEPAGGWDYKAVAEAYANEDAVDMVGETICYSYMDKCDVDEKSLMATLSLFDLSCADKMLAMCDKAAELLYEYSKNADYASTIYYAINECQKFGGDNGYQGSANLLDLVDFFQKAAVNIDVSEVMEDYGDSGDLTRLVVCGKGHPDAWGLSFYYPVVYNRNEIEKVIELGTSDSFIKYLKDYFLNIPSDTVEFADQGSVAEDGAFTVSFTPESKAYLSHINFILMTTDESGVRHIVSTDNDMDKDWENLVFKSNFRGVTLALDGHPLFYSTVSSNEKYVSFSAPVIHNGESTNMRFAFVWDDSYFNGGYYEVVGTWYGYDENGLPDNVILPLKKGDRIQVVTDVVQKNGKNEITYGDEFVIGEDGGKITEVPLDGRAYQYVYVATDRYGNNFFSNMATFEMKYTYEELLANPLPDDTYAADVTKIEAYEN